MNTLDGSVLVPDASFTVSASRPSCSGGHSTDAKPDFSIFSSIEADKHKRTHQGVVPAVFSLPIFVGKLRKTGSSTFVNEN